MPPTSLLAKHIINMPYDVDVTLPIEATLRYSAIIISLSLRAEHAAMALLLLRTFYDSDYHRVRRHMPRHYAGIRRHAITRDRYADAATLAAARQRIRWRR